MKVENTRGYGEREQTTIRLPEDLRKQIERQADKEGVSVNQLIMEAINYFLSHQK